MLMTHKTKQKSRQHPIKRGQVVNRLTGFENQFPMGIAFDPEEGFDRMVERKSGGPYSLEKIAGIRASSGTFEWHYIGDKLFDEAVAYLAVMKQSDERQLHRRGFKHGYLLRPFDPRSQKATIKHMQERFAQGRDSKFLYGKYMISQDKILRIFERKLGFLPGIEEYVDNGNHSYLSSSFEIKPSDSLWDMFAKRDRMDERRHHRRGYTNSKTMLMRIWRRHHR
jgi:hypothetical protein